jgi:hypothetical protein
MPCPRNEFSSGVRRTLAAVCLQTLVGLAGASPAPAASEVAPEETFRTPAKRYGAAYSIKAELVRDGFHYVIPVWIRPDQKESSLDPGQMRFTGWSYKDYRAEELILSGHALGQRAFKPARSDWAVKPEYPKNCCMGVIGQDLLSQYRLRFDPRPPVHIEWTRIHPEGDPAGKSLKGFDDQLKPLFTTRSEVIQVKGNRYNMGATPFELDLSAQKLVFEPNGQAQVRERRGRPVFDYEFVGFSREMGVISLDATGARQAHRLGFEPGVRVRELNGVPVSGMTRAEVDSYLRGRKGRELKIGFTKKTANEEKSTLIFDFDKNEFTPSQQVPGRSGRN